MRALRYLAILMLAFVLLGVVATLRTPRHLWRFSGEFEGCPPRPSCVSSRAAEAAQQIAPLAYAGEPEVALDRLAAIVAAMPGGRVAERQPGYLHAVFVTPRMRFHDDVEFLATPGGQIELRSLSRFGYRDMGVNRARLDQIRTAFGEGDGK